MKLSSRESLLRKVIVRFRHKAGKNGQLFPQRSWMSGLLILSSHRIILASGPFQEIIPYSNLLSIENDGSFPIPDEGNAKVIPLVHSNGIDAHISLVGVTPSVEKAITRDIYEQVCNFFKGCMFVKDGHEMPMNFQQRETGIGINSIGGVSYTIDGDTLVERSVQGSKDIWEFNIVGNDQFQLRAHPILGRWLEMFMDHYFNDNQQTIEERYMKVLRYLDEHPSTTDDLTDHLGMVSLEASTVLNEMVFLGWVALDHETKLFQITYSGSQALLKGL